MQFSPGPELAEATRPVPGPGQLLVHTDLVGVSVGLVRMLDASGGAEPGGEVVGTVVAVGEGVSAAWIGKCVGGVVFEGAYAEYVLAIPALVTQIPAGINAADALAVVRGGLVAMGAVRAGRLEKGESVLVTAAASGSGHLAMQIARALGAGRVVAAVGSPDKAEFARSCGADAVVGYDEPWGGPVDVVLDGVGGELVRRGVESLAPHGRLVAYSAGGGTVDAGSLLADLKTVTGFSVGLVSRTQPDLIDAYRADLWRMLADGDVRPRHTIFEFDDMSAALELIRTRRNTGRVAVRTR